MLPREKLFKYGPEKLDKVELLSIILGSGSKNKSVFKLARDIMHKYPDSTLAEATVEDLTSISGLGIHKAAVIIALLELSKRLIYNKQTSIVLEPEDVFKNLAGIRSSKKEHFIVLYLDARNQEIKKEIIAIGTVNASLVHPREVFEPAIKNNATSIIIAHNHPSGINIPSQEDIDLTKRLIEASKIIGIELIDHVIVTDKDFLSFKREKLLSS